MGKDVASKMELIPITDAIAEGKVYLDKFKLPCCKEHGAMNAVKSDCTVYRCLHPACHLGIKKEVKKK